MQLHTPNFAFFALRLLIKPAKRSEEVKQSGSRRYLSEASHDLRDLSRRAQRAPTLPACSCILSAFISGLDQIVLGEGLVPCSRHAACFWC